MILKADGSAAGTLTADADGSLRFTNAAGDKTVISIRAAADGHAMVLHDAAGDAAVTMVSEANAENMPAETNSIAVANGVDEQGNARVELEMRTDINGNSFHLRNGTDSDGEGIPGLKMDASRTGNFLRIRQRVRRSLDRDRRPRR